MNGPKRVYLDHAATTPVLPDARAAVFQALERWSNPSSPHTDGRAARAALEKARRTIADALEWRHDVVLTSGASEAILIAARQAKVPGRAIGATEHDAVRAAFGRAKVVPVGEAGLIDRGALAEMIAGTPSLVAIQQVNNETGVIQPIDQIAAEIRAAGSLLLADCAQSAGKLPLPDANFISVSAHKLGGPPGVGALLVRDLARLHAVGGQEKGYRRGTENLPAAAGFAAALSAGAYDMARLSQLRQALEKEIEGAGGTVIGNAAPRLATIGCYAMPGVTSASQLVQFDLAGFSVSAGSACSSGSMKPSRVLQAMELPEEVVGSAIRVSFGADTTDDDVAAFVAEWRRIFARAQRSAA
ncbi:cysteine desulfurase family protein [Sphingomonas piscis]|uniref:cysteine desulfurase family protein n=1 Tax=Sphingomonas piscis TaxID=2714943 RepID=UPI001FECDFD6|nr:aminotransferase class V-fold PLP-dependent enzyme [Sphingomonas piscis]